MPYCTKCGEEKRRLSKNSFCNECEQANNSAGGNTLLETGEEIPDDTSGYWEHMNKLLDTKFTKFEQTFKTTILNEVKQITDPIEKEVKELKDENKKLKSKVTLLEAKDKEKNTKLEQVENTLKEHQKYLSRTDKEARSRRLILAGIPEGNVKINDKETSDDKVKVEEVLKVVDAGILSANIRRIGKKDQGVDNRPRYLMLEFGNSSDRHSVKKNSHKLKENHDTKNFYMKADSTKKERDEYKRLYDVKKRLEEEDPGKTIKIEYGKLYVEDTIVDQISTASSDFLG